MRFSLKKKSGHGMHHVRPEDRVPIGQKIAYGLGGPLEILSVTIPKSVITPVFNIGMGLNPVLISLVAMLWRAWDAFSDPVMGNISDNARTRWGRRRPFIVLGAILTGLTMPIMWWAPESLSQWQLFTWLLVTGILFYTCFTIWSMPYYSLNMEMSPSYDERTIITAYRAVPQKLAYLLAGWIIALASMSIFGVNADGTPNLINGMRWISLCLAGATIVLGVLPGIFVKERYYAKTKGQKKRRLMDDVKQTFRTKPFLILLTIVFTKLLGFGFIGTLGFYLNAYYVCGGDIKQAAVINGVKASMLILPNLFAVPFCTWLSSCFGKRVVLYVISASTILGFLSVYIFYDPAHPWLQLIPALLVSPLSAGIWLIAPSMQADVADFDELETGNRREGSFSAVFSWTTKMTSTITTGLGGFVLVWTGFDVAHGAEQPPHVLDNIMHCYVLIPVAFSAVNIVCVYFYSLTRERMEDIRAQLEERRGAL
ncbi:MFS transporter [Ruficoccus sp. ZRK36]|uniref:MFS transporter n=1 Tax=Ruficoccus sp. ZRK36 TaxID=2866311 RepID=UPI001C72FCAD|nr:MFS transporter [Ruficoccus sp. ZRK36]QYY35056.1 MFS transporter [Ruficoccus sp. ZRK36]